MADDGFVFDRGELAEHPVTIRGATPQKGQTSLITTLECTAEVVTVRGRNASFDLSARDHVPLAELDGQVVGVLASSLTPRFAEPGIFSRIIAPGMWRL